jgi:biopolymer transport protein ExbD/biopolymer transport protein TolR
MAMSIGNGNGGRGHRELSDINVTPFVDVVLVLLIIFMLTAPILQSSIDVNVPKTKTVKEIAEERLIVSIDRKQRVFLGNDAVNVNELGAKIRQKVRDPQNESVFLRSDEDVPWGAVATVTDKLLQAGITHINVVTQPLDEHGSKR